MTLINAVNVPIEDRDKYNLIMWRGIIFDDSVYCNDDLSPAHYWSEVSEESVIKYGIARTMLSDGAPGICGIKGHSEMADYYLDMPLEEVFIIKEELQ